MSLFCYWLCLRFNILYDVDFTGNLASAAFCFWATFKSLYLSWASNAIKQLGNMWCAVPKVIFQTLHSRAKAHSSVTQSGASHQSHIPLLQTKLVTFWIHPGRSELFTIICPRDGRDISVQCIGVQLCPIRTPTKRNRRSFQWWAVPLWREMGTGETTLVISSY